MGEDEPVIEIRVLETREQEKWCLKIQGENRFLNVQPMVWDAVNMPVG